MQFNNTLNISDILEIITLITILIGGFFALYKWSKSMRIKRADYIKSLIDINNKEMWVDFLELFGGRIKADGLDNFYDCFVDPITLENLKYYKLPTDFVSVLL